MHPKPVADKMGCFRGRYQLYCFCFHDFWILKGFSVDALDYTLESAEPLWAAMWSDLSLLISYCGSSSLA